MVIIDGSLTVSPVACDRFAVSFGRCFPSFKRSDKLNAMVTAIKQRVRVEAGGRVAVQSPELHEGESAEVIVMVDRPSARGPDERLKALDQVRQSLNLSPSLVARWETDMRAERAAWRGRPSE
jgi:hypothetical protein